MIGRVRDTENFVIFELNGADHSRTNLVETGPPPDKHLDHRRSITAVSLSAAVIATDSLYFCISS